MKVYELNQEVDIDGSVVALGSFDGLHKAHMQIICVAEKFAKENNLKAGVLLFDRLPSKVFSKNVKRIMNLDDQKKLLSDMDFVYIQEFSESFMNFSPEEFALFLKKKLKVKAVSVGFNYRFGKNAEGDVFKFLELGEKYGFKVLISDEYKIGDETVSSSKIRGFVEDGDIKKAGEFLGRDFFMTGTVLSGFHLGRTFGFPTVNLSYEENSIIPKIGVYHGVVEVDEKRYKAVINVGKRPTFERDDITIESFILNFEGDLYDKKIRVYFKEYLRPEIKFPDAKSLSEQIKKDIEKVK